MKDRWCNAVAVLFACAMCATALHLGWQLVALGELAIAVANLMCIEGVMLFVVYCAFCYREIEKCTCAR